MKNILILILFLLTLSNKSFSHDIIKEDDNILHADFFVVRTGVN